MILLQYRLGAPLMIGVGVAIEKQNRDRFDTEALEAFAERRDLAVVKRGVDLAIGQHALLDLETQRPLDQRHVFLEEQIVGIGPVDAADLVDVAKAFGDQQRRAGAGALQHRVDGDGRAMQEQRRRPVIAAGLGDAGGNAFDQMRRRRQRLAECERAGLFVEHGDIGKGAPDIRGEPHLTPCHSFFPSGAAAANG